MAKIRVTKSFTFEMAHALWNYDGPCRNIHGHSYQLYVTIIGNTNSDLSNTKLGMVMDFSDLKKIVGESVVDVFDHSVVISSRASQPEIQRVEQMFDKFYVVDYQPTCENLVTDMAARITPALPEGISLFSLKLAETATSYAEWFASENL
ncbi:6-pyruvoyl tetrahydropterin synthase family protein [Bacteroidota bacterium]